MRIEINKQCTDFDSYRAARVKSLFNVEDGHTFHLTANLDLPTDWGLGLIVGPSGSGKTSLGAQMFNGRPRSTGQWVWPSDAPIIEVIGPHRGFDDVTNALSAVGLGSVPAWLRPFNVLSNGEQFRAGLARLLCEAPDTAVIDEFTSVIDRQVAKVGAAAFGRAWRKTGGQAVLMSCHYDIVRWLQPDWVFDTSTGQFTGRYLRPRPRIKINIHECGREMWPLFEAHHYLKVPYPIAATYYIAECGGRAIAHLAMSPRPGLLEARACRFVVLPDWQGAGVGTALLNGVADLWREGANRFNKPMRTTINTSHPGLAASLRRNRDWGQISAALYGGNKARSARHDSMKSGYGGHFRATQGFRYLI